MNCKFIHYRYHTAQSEIIFFVVYHKEKCLKVVGFNEVCILC
jgi:hypothetical protein